MKTKAAVKNKNKRKKRKTKKIIHIQCLKPQINNR